MAEARARVACGSGTPVSAVYLPSGAIEVTCRQNVPRRTATDAAPEVASKNSLGGTGLATGPAAGAIAAAIVLGVVVGDSGNSTTTTTTPSGSAFE